MDDQNKNLMLATGLSLVVILVWFALFPPPEPTQAPDAPAQTTQSEATVGDTAAAPNLSGDATDTTTTETSVVDPTAGVDRIAIDTTRLKGSLSLLGGRIDELALKDYRVTTDPDAEIVDLLKPTGTDSPYYALYGWAPGAGLTIDQVPGPTTVWSVAPGTELTADTPATLTWDNGAGLTFTRTVSVDENFMFNVTQGVTNTGAGTVKLAPYGILARHGEPKDLKNFFILHEGLVSMTDGELSEIDYGDLTDFEFDPREGARANLMPVEESGWIGFTDHFWMTTLIPADGTFRVAAKYDDRRDIYQAETLLATETLSDGQTAEVTTQLFAGAKEWDTIRNYERSGVTGFLDSIDWGWFFFLTKPIFAVLHYIHLFIGNMGWSIIGLTLVIKLILFPLAYKSYVSMAKMKELQPEMEKIKEAAGDDRQKLQQEMMALYKKEKVNPASGCLPILLQIPIFFSLYKVIFVTIELRQATWLGPFQDLSAPDPTSLINLFGLLPNASPEPGSVMALVFIGILPLLLGISMWLQQKLNPAPTDPTQQMIFAWMPWVFMFMLGGFASGLVVYWIANNVITFTQQYLIMRSQGYNPDVFGNIKKSFNRKPKEE